MSDKVNILAGSLPKFINSVIALDSTSSGHTETVSLANCLVAITNGTDSLPAREAPYDAALVVCPTIPELSDLFRKTEQLLDRFGMVFLAVSSDEAANLENLVAEASQDNLLLYVTWGSLGEDHVLLFVKSGYEPLQHARHFFVQGAMMEAYEVLCLIPESFLDDPKAVLVVNLTKQLCLLGMDKTSSCMDDIERFFRSQVLFYRIVKDHPHAWGAYRNQAAFWARIGDTDMAARLLRSVEYVAPSTETRDLISEYGVLPSRRRATYTVPDIPNGPPPLKRVLLITHPRPHYGIDVLYNGLCIVLGDENVIEYPWKPTLHGHVPDSQAHYPCMFNHGGEPLTVPELIEQTKAGRFDAILYADIERTLLQDESRALVHAREDVPVFLLDQQDDCINNLAKMCDHLGRDQFDGYFKREMLTCVDYGPRARPMPFSYADEKVPETISGERSNALFWAGHREFGTRRLYLESIENSLGIRLDGIYTQEIYRQVLNASLIGLSIFGFGFDTVRYWELPAHGCLLLSERLPIHVPKNFRDGETAVFFDDLPELHEKLDYYLNHVYMARGIAQRGHEHLKAYHTASARARQLLAWMRALASTGAPT